MRLVKLSANMPPFQDFTFKPGLNFIIGKREDPDKKEQNKTYNGVGKSLLIFILHFCLGSDTVKIFEEKLPEWEFTLDFEIGNDSFQVKRKCKKQNTVILNNDEMKLDAYKDLLAKKVFFCEGDKISNLSFRSLLLRFIRPNKFSYNRFDTFLKEETDFVKLINNAFLLGLDPNIVLRKKTIKEEMDKIKKLQKNIQEDEVLVQYFTEENDVDIELIDIKEKISKLEKELHDFNVAENYHEIKCDADNVASEIRSIENENTLMQNSVKSIEKSMKNTPDVTKDHLEKLYNEAKIVMPENVIKTIDEVENFHKSLITSRDKRLYKQLNEVKEKLASNEEKRKLLGSKLDANLKFLGTHGALDEFVALNKKLNELQFRFEKLSEFKNINTQYKNKLSKIKINLEQEALSSQEYLDEIKPVLEKNNGIFRDISRIFYKDKPGGIEIKNNIGTNQIRYNIDARIQDDSSDGINEVKIFCYDFTILKLQHNHNMNFLFHDSRLFSNMDPRQRMSWLKVISEYENSENFQYIASINEDMITSLADFCSVEEYDYFTSLVERNKRLTLTDKDAESKLLGIQIDLSYAGT